MHEKSALIRNLVDVKISLKNIITTFYCYLYYYYCDYYQHSVVRLNTNVQYK